MTIDSSGINSIDALAAHSWNATQRTAAKVTYSFMTALPPDATAEDAEGFAPLTSMQQQAVRDCFALWSAVADIVFTEVKGEGGAAGQIRLASNNQNAAESAGYSDFPSDGAADAYVYTYFNNMDASNSKLNPGDYGLLTFIHELGHAIGLKHPGNYNGSNGSSDGPYLPQAKDTTDYSVMSYYDGKAYLNNFKSPASPMMYDIQAVQYLYGPNLRYRVGNDSYAFSDNSPPVCIWDAGGENTLDFSACTTPTVMNLRDGSFSSTSADMGNISIAVGVRMQNAIGGKAHDDIFMADYNGTVNSGAGDDAITLGSGQITVDAGDGTDSITLSGVQKSYVIQRLSNTAESALLISSVEPNIRYTVKNVESIRFSDATVNPQAINTSPFLQKPLHDTFAGLGKELHFNIASNSFVDYDPGDKLSYRITSADGKALPSWLKFSSETLSFTGTPTSYGTVAINLLAEDSAGHASSASFHISTVQNYGAEFTASGLGNQTFTAGAGLDQILYPGNRSDYTITAKGNGVFAVAKGNSNADTLSGIDRIKFSDASVALDVGKGHAGVAYGLYQAAFNRTPDASGLGFWINALDTGVAAIDIMKTFITSPEFVSTYNQLDNAGFVNQIYQNVLHRQADAGGLNFWLDGINSGKAGRADVVNFFTQSDEFQGNMASVIGNGFVYTPYFG